MHTTGEGASEPIAAVRLAGKRFDAHGIPASSLPEIVAFEELVRELAKAIFRNRNNRKRVPSGYDSLITLRLTEVRDGSSTSVLERPIDLQGDLFSTEIGAGSIGDELIAQDLGQARGYVEQFIESASTGGDIPDLIYQVPISFVRKIGQTLHKGDTLQVADRGDANWAARRTYSPETRERIIRRMGASKVAPASVRGYVEQVNTSNKTCTIRSTDKNLVVVPYSETGFRLEIDASLEVSDLPDYFAAGTGEYNSAGVLLRLTAVDEFRLASPEVFLEEVEESIRDFSSLSAGWIDGDLGVAPNDKTLAIARDLLRLLDSWSALTRYVYPTPEGGVQFEWSIGDTEISLELEPESTVANLRKTSIETAERSALTTDFGSNANEMADWLIAALGRDTHG